MFSRDGQILWEREAIGRTAHNFNPAILPGDSICLIPSIMSSGVPGRTEIIDCADGSLIETIAHNSTWYMYPPDGELFLIGGRIGYSISQRGIVWEKDQLGNTPLPLTSYIVCSNNMRVIGALAIDERNGERDEAVVALTGSGQTLLQHDIARRQRPVVSPNGYFFLAQVIKHYNTLDSPTPINLWTFGGDF
jgi:hypothetical protein